MRKFALTIMVCLMGPISQAQESLRFMGIPMKGTVEEFADRLVKEKRFSIVEPNDYESQNLVMETKKLKGDFEMFKNCNLYVRRADGLTEVSSVYVEVDTILCSKENFDKFIEYYDKIYGEHSYWFGSPKWEVKNGQLYAGMEDGVYAIVYMDKSEVDFREKKVADMISEAMSKVINEKEEKETIKEICGIPFGSSYETAKEMLRNKYGIPEYSPNRTEITYKKKNYAGISFDVIHFLFESDGYKSYLNGCVFILDAKTLGEAEKKQRMLYEELSKKYIMTSTIDDDGNKVYGGGYSPVKNDGIGFLIDIIKYDKDIAKWHVPYAARLAYGRYHYIKEEF